MKWSNGQSLTNSYPNVFSTVLIFTGSDTYRGGRRLSSYQRRVFTARVLKVGVLSPDELNTDNKIKYSINTLL